MALVRPPKSTIERRVEELIDKAASAHPSKTANSEQGVGPEQVPVTVRIPAMMLQDIERLVKQRPIKTARHTWLMEALYEKWKKETSAAEGSTN
jgi:hypothetical protein